MSREVLFLTSLRKISTWSTVFFTVALFYFLSIAIIRFDSIFSFFSNLGFWDGFRSVLSLYLYPMNTFSVFNFIFFLITVTLFALQIVALRLYTSKRFYHKENKISLLGIMGALLGCIACCGSVLIAAVTAFIGVSFASLPFGGQELTLLGFTLSLGSLIYTVRKIDSPLVC